MGKMDFLETAIYRIILKTYMYMQETGRTESFERFPYLHVLTQRLTGEMLERWQHDTGMQAERYYGLISRMNGTSLRDNGDGLEADILCNVLDLCIAAMYVPEFAAYLNYYTGNMVTIQLAAEMEGIAYENYSDMMRRLCKIRKVCWIDQKKGSLPHAAIEGDDVLLSFLTGDDRPDKVFSGEAEWFGCNDALSPMFIRQDMAQKGAKFLRDTESSARVLLLSGKGGRRFMAKHIAHQLGKDLLLVDLAKCRNPFGEDAERFWGKLVHAVFLYDALVCIYGIASTFMSQFQITGAALEETAVRPFLDAGCSVILCAEPGISLLADSKNQVRSIDIGEITREEREAVFRGFAKRYQISLDCAYYSVRYRLSASEIADAMETWRSAGGAELDELMQICDTVLYKSREKVFGQILYPSVGFADLKLPKHMKGILEQICSSVTDGYKIFEEWNLKRQYPYGRAVTVLLSGPPGTGKTMSAHVLAKELGIALYQVDLSQVLDKYIGETEKHLEQIFEFAGKVKPVLFFDEADSLFGKRGEVTDGKDRYANMEVSYILQRIEQFDGVVVLATNFYNNIDKAFLRRMKYVLKYQSPDAGIRRSIWADCMPPELPREELDLDYLAHQFDFTGGMIKNVVYVACVMAIHQGTNLRMEHILMAIRAEYEKMERTITKDMWGEYGYLLE
ncbi:MAG: ATP-binding protein [Lachnospiraceae bacterium]|nr:ATP-binding protein [Lachnospiraceae bacterium]